MYAQCEMAAASVQHYDSSLWTVCHRTVCHGCVKAFNPVL